MTTEFFLCVPCIHQEYQFQLQHTPIIDIDAFERVQEKVTVTKKHYPKYSRQAPVEFMLKGMVRCSNCGATLTMQAKHNGLQCHNYARGACKVRTVSACSFGVKIPFFIL